MINNKLLLLILLLFGTSAVSSNVLNRRKHFQPAVETGGGGGGTDWTADSSMIALYLFEASPGIGQDSDGSSHFDDEVSSPSPVAETTSGEFKEGSQGAMFDVLGTDSAAVCSNANLDGSFPGNGSSQGEISLGGWIYVNSSTAIGYIFTYAGGINRILLLANNTVQFKLYGAADVTFTSTETIDDNTLTFFVVTYSDTDDEVAFYFRPDGGSSTYETYSASTVGTLDNQTADVMFGNNSDGGNGFGFDGVLDAWAFFTGEALTETELDGIYTNGWDGDGW